MEIRDCAVKTVGTISFPDLLFPVKLAKLLVESAEKFSSTEQISNGLILHHSRDTPKKQFEDTIISGLKIVGQAEICMHALSSMEMDFIIEQHLESSTATSEELTLAIVRLVVDVVMAAKFQYLPIVEKILTRSVSSHIGPHLLPQLMEAISRATNPSEQLVHACYILFSNLMDRENDPLLPDETIVTSEYEYRRIPVSRLVLNVIDHLGIFEKIPKFFEKFLNPKFFMTNGATVRIALGIMDHVTPERFDHHMPEDVQQIYISQMTGISKFRDELGIYKYAITRLLGLSMTAAIVEIFDSLDCLGTDQVDHRLFDFLMKNVWEDKSASTRFGLRIFSIISSDQGKESTPEFRLEVTLTTLRGILRPTSAEFIQFDYHSRELFTSTIGRCEALLTDSTAADETKITILNSLSFSTVQESVEFFVKLMPSISSHLINTENIQIRSVVAQLFSTYAPSIVRKFES